MDYSPSIGYKKCKNDLTLIKEKLANYKKSLEIPYEKRKVQQAIDRIKRMVMDIAILPNEEESLQKIIKISSEIEDVAKIALEKETEYEKIMRGLYEGAVISDKEELIQRLKNGL